MVRKNQLNKAKEALFFGFSRGNIVMENSGEVINKLNLPLQGELQLLPKM